MSATQPQGEEESTNPNKKKKAPEPKAPEPKAPEPKAPVVSQQEEEDMCPVCVEPLQKDPTKFIRYTCCGKGIHKWCDAEIDASSLSQKQKNSCPLCRTKYPNAGEESVERLRPWVDKGKAWAQNILGQKYKNGDGVEQSYQQARELYELSANQGDAGSQYDLGVLYSKGQGVDQSYERAVEYYEAAARQGLASAQFNLGSRYALGQGVEKSFEKAREWWMKSAEQGQEGAINGLQKLDEIEGKTIPSFIPKPIECASCYRPHDPPEHRLSACKRCYRVFYCGKECQKKHWKRKRNGHKGLCTPESEKAREARKAQETKKGGGGEEPKTTTPTTGTHVTFRF
jgi:hypothetical protein